jgi:hypothetical protein
MFVGAADWLPNHIVSSSPEWKERFFPVIQRQLLKHGLISILQIVETLEIRKVVWAESTQFAAVSTDPNHSNGERRTVIALR